MTRFIPVLGFVVLGLGAALALAGAPRLRRPGIDPALFERATDGASRLACAACGSAPILMLSVAYAGFVPLPLLLGFVVMPAYGAIAFLGMLLPNVGRRAVTGFLAGIVAVLVYDLTRLALSYSQGGGDPIPHIGVMLMGDGAPWWLGYAWRTLGNGAGLGVVFAMICPRKWWSPKTGLVYASMIGLGMLAFLSLFPQAQSQLFKVSWQTMVNSSLGHATYGLVLGSMCRASVRRRARQAEVRGRHAAPDEGISSLGAVRPGESGEPASPSAEHRSADSSGHGPSWVRPAEQATDWLPRVPTVPPPPSPRRRARGSHSR